MTHSRHKYPDAPELLQQFACVVQSPAPHLEDAGDSRRAEEVLAHVGGKFELGFTIKELKTILQRKRAIRALGAGAASRPRC